MMTTSLSMRPGVEGGATIALTGVTGKSAERPVFVGVRRIDTSASGQDPRVRQPATDAGET